VKVMVPLTIASGQVVETNAPASADAAWSAGTSYTAGQTVQVDGLRRYEALSGSTNKPPATNPALWLDLGATNPWRPFDGVVGSQAAGAEDYDAAEYNAEAEPAGLDAGLAYTLAPGAAWDTLVLFGLRGRLVDVVVRDGDDAVVYASRSVLDGEIPDSTWWHWAFSPIERLSTVVLADTGGAFGADSTVAISVVAADGDEAKIGNILLGLGQWIGDALYPAEVGDVDFSAITEDDFGGVTLTPRAWSARADLTLVLPEERVPSVFRLLASLRASAVVWIPDPRPAFAPAVIYGFRRRFFVDYETAGTAYLTLSLRGLV
jgi:hypothetical protein